MSYTYFHYSIIIIIISKREIKKLIFEKAEFDSINMGRKKKKKTKLFVQYEELKKIEQFLQY